MHDASRIPLNPVLFLICAAMLFKAKGLVTTPSQCIMGYGTPGPWLFFFSVASHISMAPSTNIFFIIIIIIIIINAMALLDLSNKKNLTQLKTIKRKRKRIERNMKKK